ncbi:hypothetical protein ACIG47_13475 [Promicromonospora sp. NPDC052451]|uniref:hypothetical protein n=1 Tax=Promicromonospora sp. NPDC052451 TaxID=3364407 RepID=UPI0037C8C366
MTAGSTPLTVEVVFEVHTSADFDLWPTQVSAGGPYLRASGEMLEAEVGATVEAFLSSWYFQSATKARTPEEYVSLALATRHPEDDVPSVDGGLRITDSRTGVVVLPGCCADLDILSCVHDFLAGGRVWGFHGHDPSPSAERIGGGVLRLHVDDERPEAGYINTSEAEMRERMVDVESDLRGFLDRLAGWADEYVPGHHAVLVALFRAALWSCPFDEDGRCASTASLNVCSKWQ